jgi:hypothetical protein
MVTANKGEWAELYAFLKVISERDIPLADENLGAIGGSFITFLNVHRALPSGKVAIFHLAEDSVTVKSDEFDDIVVPVATLTSKTPSIFAKVAAGTGAFALPEAQEMMAALQLHSVKAPSAQKADLVATILDRSTKTSDLTGFSTKSFLGASATLLNASGATNFRYRVTGLAGAQVAAINAVEGRSKLRDRFALMAAGGAKIEFSSIASATFSANLRKIDTMLPEFIAHMLLAYYQGKGNSCVDLVAHLAAHNPDVARFALSAEDLAFKIKQLLVNIALGLVPNSPWDGMQKAHGGYLIVKRAGDVVCYHAIHRDKFLQYLYIATKFDTPSTSKHHFGDLFEAGGEVFINLNLQIRFK